MSGRFAAKSVVVTGANATTDTGIAATATGYVSAAVRKAMPKADSSKWVSLEAAAEAIVHLASPQNAAVSGALVPIYGRA